MNKTVTVEPVEGLTLEIDTARLDDMELIDDLAELAGGNTLKLSGILRRFLGEENKRKLYDALRNERGIVSSTAANAALNRIFEQIGDGKKS